MAILDYSKRLSNLRSRKFDYESDRSVLSESFSSNELPNNVKYMVESMVAIDKAYNDRTIKAAENVQTHLERGCNLHFTRDYRTQGSITTRTNIKVHSDFDLLTIIDKYHYPEVLHGPEYTESDPHTDIVSLRSQSTEIMKRTYDEVDDSGDKSISIFNKNLHRKVDIVFAYWYYSEKFRETQSDYYKGVYLYNFAKKERILDYPFATIKNVNDKGDITADGSRKGIRLLKNMKADADIKLDLSSFQLTSLVHAIDNASLFYTQGNELGIAQAMSAEMYKLIVDSDYRNSVSCPTGIENPFENDDCVPHLRYLKSDLDVLIEDATSEILASPVVKNLVRNYGMSYAA